MKKGPNFRLLFCKYTDDGYGTLANSENQDAMRIFIRVSPWKGQVLLKQNLSFYHVAECLLTLGVGYFSISTNMVHKTLLLKPVMTYSKVTRF